MHWVLAGALVLIGVFVVVALYMVNSQAGDSQASTTIENAAPTVTSVFISDSANGGVDSWPGGIPIIAGGTQTIHINGVVADKNSGAEVQTVSAVFYLDDGVRTESCKSSADKNNCYTVGTCALGTASGNNRPYNCQMGIEYFADSNKTGGSADGDDWRVAIYVEDDDTANTQDDSKTTDINLMTAVDHDAGIPFGTRTNGETSTLANNVDFEVTQWGNDQVDVQLKLKDPELNCTDTGTIPAANLKYSTTDQAWEGTTGNVVLTTTNATLDVDLDYRTDDAVEVDDLIHWNIQIPDGVEGVCTEDVVVTAIPA